MNTQFVFLAGTLAALALVMPAFAAPLSAASQQADTPAVAVVREFLADRNAGKYDAAYALLSADLRQQIPEGSFAAGNPPSPFEAHNWLASTFGLFVLWLDTHNTLNYTFTLIGPDPANPGIVLIRAAPPAGNNGLSTATLRLQTVTDSTAHASRIDIFSSLKRSAPRRFGTARDHAERTASQSNLKQLALGVILYGQDHNEKMPDAADWVDEILPYVKTEAIFRDPSAPVGEKWSYAFNSTLSHQPIAALDYPAHTVLLFESSLGVKNASDTGQSVPVPGRHLGGTDYATADGHVQWFPDGTVFSYRLNGK